MALKDLFQKLMKNPSIVAPVNQMYGSLGADAQKAFLNRPKMAAALKLANDGSTGVDYVPIDAENPSTAAGRLGELFSANGGGGPGDPGAPGIGDLGSLALSAAKAHPFKTAGLVGLGASNIGGLMDNNKFGGQLGGLALGGLGSYLSGASPYTAAMLTMGGGALGSLFDKLRAKKEQEQTQPYYGGR